MSRALQQHVRCFIFTKGGLVCSSKRRAAFRDVLRVAFQVAPRDLQHIAVLVPHTPAGSVRITAVCRCGCGVPGTARRRAEGVEELHLLRVCQRCVNVRSGARLGGANAFLPGRVNCGKCFKVFCEVLKLHSESKKKTKTD